MTKREYDAIVIGGGPGGSSASTFLAKKGYSVLLLEKERFPRFHVGESLIPGVLDLLWELGVDEAVEDAGFIHKPGGNLASQRGEYVKFHLDLVADQLRKPYSYEVLRSEFDKLLLDHSRAHAVEVREGYKVEGVLMENGRAFGVAYCSARGREGQAYAPMIIDASGRDTLLASRLRLKRKDSTLNKVSVFAHFTRVERDSGRDEGNLIIALFRHGWFWIIPLAGEATSIGVVVDASYAKAFPGGVAALFGDTIRQCPFVADRMRAATQVTKLYVDSNLAYRSKRLAGDGYILVGDAGVFIDPIYSFGVYLALKSGKMAAERIDHAFKTGDFSAATFRPYEEAIQREVDVVFKQVYAWYRFIGDERRVERLVPLMIRFTSIRRNFTMLFSGMYDQIDPDRVAFVQLLKDPLYRGGQIAKREAEATR